MDKLLVFKINDEGYHVIRALLTRIGILHQRTFENPNTTVIDLDIRVLDVELYIWRWPVSYVIIFHNARDAKKIYNYLVYIRRTLDHIEAIIQSDEVKTFYRHDILETMRTINAMMMMDGQATLRYSEQ